MFQAYVERLFNNKILAVQTDWRGEYHKLSSFFARIGISHLIFYPHTHQQNGAMSESIGTLLVQVSPCLPTHQCH
jgi:hypothetical protein